MISIAKLAAALGIDVPTGDELVEFTRQRDAALAYLNRQTRRFFGPVESFEEILIGKGLRSLWLTYHPVVGESYDGVTVQEYAYAGAVPGDLTEGATDGFELRVSTESGKLVRLGAAGRWTRGHEYVVSYPRGYVEDAGPPDVEELLIELVGIEWNAPESDLMKSETIGGYSYTRFDSSTLSDRGQKTLAAWTRPVFG